MSILIALGGVVLSCLLFRFRLRGGRSERPWLTALLTCGVALICGVILSKLVYALCQFQRTFMLSGFGALFASGIDQFSFVGFAAGSMLGARVFLNLVEHTSLGSVPTLNLYAPCWALMLAVIRFSEHWQGIYGVGEMIENEAHQFFPLGQMIDYGGGVYYWFYAVNMFECAWALICCGVCLLVQKIRKDTYKTGFSAARICFYLCLLQILFQSLRASDNNKWLFVRVEQLLCGLLVLFFIIRYIWMTAHFRKEKITVASCVPAIVTVAAILLVVLAEFILDKSVYFYGIPLMGPAIENDPVPVAYIIMGIALAIMAAMEVWTAKLRFDAQKQKHFVY